ncbi:MAG: hypothetical protein AAF927_06235 [Bacteroidota bacterium]
MRPVLKVSNLISLQDARSSAAVGFDLISFSLERGSSKKLSSSLIWNIVQWLSGPEVVLELNLMSLEELEEVKKLFEWSLITLPFEEYDERLLSEHPKLILRTDQFTDPAKISEIVEQAADAGADLKFEVSLPDAESASAYLGVAEYVFLHFASLDALISFVNAAPFAPYGLSLGEEAEEEPGFLHYERIDDLMDLLDEV